jgi:metal-dependent amidase/aminoacylase/carboxypeptidase family protein
VSLPTYFPYEPNEALAAVVAQNCDQILGADQVDRTRRHVSACSDIGDVALVMPTVHVFSSSGNGAPTHSRDYWVTDYDQACIEPAKYLAMSVVDLLSGSADLARRVLRDEPAPMTMEEYLAERKRLAGT